MLKVTESRLTLIVAILALAIPIFWDMWIHSDAVTVTIQHRYVLIENNGSIQGLTVNLGNAPITKLVATELSVENTGRVAITKDDILQPLTMNFSAARILDVKLKNRYPNNLEYSIKTLNPTQFQVNFDLLNDGERLVLVVLTNRIPGPIGASARIKNISNLTVNDLDIAPPLYKRIPTSVYYIAAISAFFFILSFYLLRNVFGPLHSDAMAVPKLMSAGFRKDELTKFLSRNIWRGYSETQLDLIRKQIDAVDSHDEKEVAKLADKIKFEALNRDATGSQAILFVVSCIGLIYATARIAIAIAYP